MPRVRSGHGRRRTRRRGASASSAAQAGVQRTEEKPVRGVKLKHVSWFTMIVAVLCLLAYLAGRVDVSAAKWTPTRAPAPVHAQERAPLGNNNAGRLF
jgi:hypothetical protein